VKIRYKPVSKPGQYGTLYLYAYEYTCAHDQGCPVFKGQKWGYDSEHVYLWWSESAAEDGWELLSVKRVNSDIPARRGIAQ
jgi:hypothetical protein